MIAELDSHGFAILPSLLEPEACERLVAGYDQDLFRSTITMARHGFGSGEYKYFRYPSPT